MNEKLISVYVDDHKSWDLLDGDIFGTSPGNRLIDPA
jgi:hypothetical protein